MAIERDPSLPTENNPQKFEGSVVYRGSQFIIKDGKVVDRRPYITPEKTDPPSEQPVEIDPRFCKFTTVKTQDGKRRNIVTSFFIEDPNGRLGQLRFEDARDAIKAGLPEGHSIHYLELDLSETVSSYNIDLTGAPKSVNFKPIDPSDANFAQIGRFAKRD